MNWTIRMIVLVVVSALACRIGYVNARHHAIEAELQDKTIKATKLSPAEIAAIKSVDEAPK